MTHISYIIVHLWFNDEKRTFKNFNHTAITFVDNKGKSHFFEYGIKKNKTNADTRFWVEDMYSRDVSIYNINLDMVSENALLWRELFSHKPGNYPGNCRGYVDFALRNMFGIQIAWKTMTIQSVPGNFNYLDESKLKAV